jgi:hypothetical protein
MAKGFVIKGNACQTKNPNELDLYERAFPWRMDRAKK